MRSANNSVNTIQSTLKKLAKFDYTNDSEAAAAYHSIWRVNQQLFPLNKASRTTNSNIGEWERSELSQEFRSTLRDFEVSTRQLERSIKSCNWLKRKAIEKTMDWGLRSVDSRARTIRQRNAKCLKDWEEIEKYPVAQKALEKIIEEQRNKMSDVSSNRTSRSKSTEDNDPRGESDEKSEDGGEADYDNDSHDDGSRISSNRDTRPDSDSDDNSDGESDSDSDREDSTVRR